MTLSHLSFLKWSSWPLRRTIISLATLFALVWSDLAYCGEIHDAAANGDLEMVKSLVNTNAELVNSKDANPRPDLHSETPLHLAAQYDREDIVQFLLANKADVNAKDDYGRTPLYWAALCGSSNVVQL